MEHTENVERRFSTEVGSSDPAVASFRIGGKLNTLVELRKGERVYVTIGNADGQVVASGEGNVKSMAFKDHDGLMPYTEREHKVKLD